MERMTLREAAQRTARSITTLRRYIRSGRLRAEKRFGRFGPEYFLSTRDLNEAGLEVERPERPAALPVADTESPAASTAVAPPATAAAGVPIPLFQELQMKHEQLLVQYGMIRAGGMRAMELSTENQALKRQLRERTSDHERRTRRITGEASARAWASTCRRNSPVARSRLRRRRRPTGSSSSAGFR